MFLSVLNSVVVDCRASDAGWVRWMVSSS